VGDLQPEVSHGDLLVVAAVGLLTTSDEMIPSNLSSSSCRRNTFLHSFLKLCDDSLPDLFDVCLNFCDDQLTASGTFITSLQKLAVFFLSLSIGSLVDHLSVLPDERPGGRFVPTFDLGLDIVQAFDHEAFCGQGLTHVASALCNLCLLDSHSSTKKGSSDKCVSSHRYLIIKIFKNEMEISEK